MTDRYTGRTLIISPEPLRWWQLWRRFKRWRNPKLVEQRTTVVGYDDTTKTVRFK